MKNQFMSILEGKKYIKQGHSRAFLSGIFDACSYETRKTSFCKQQQQVRGRSPITTFGDDSFFYKQQLSGFTLIELLVVVLIIGILAAVALPQYQKAVLKTRFMQLVVLQDAIDRAEQVYYLANNTYTSDFDSLDVQMPSGTISIDNENNRSIWSSGDYTIILAPLWSQGHYKGLSYVTDHNSPIRDCRVYNNSDITRGVCLSLGGVKQTCSSCSYESYYF